MSGQALAGLAANHEFVVVADRDALDSADVFRCLKLETGDEVWTLHDPAPGNLDYGNSARATPLIQGELVFLYNAFSRLHCARLATGDVVWKKTIHRQFNVQDDRPWGTSSSPLVVDDLLVVNPGAANASVVALRPDTGTLVWQTPGDQAAYSSYVVGTLGGRRQLVGYERQALCGYEIATGKPLWRLVPPRPNDFNVPTPIVVGGRLLVSTENNGTRLYGFDDQGVIVTEPSAVNEELAPDTHTPVVVGDRVFGVSGGLYCLDLANGLATRWTSQDPAFDDYAVAVASDQRVLFISMHGELVLIDAQADSFQPLSRVRVFEDDPGVYAHPALVGTRLLVRGSSEIVCLELATSDE